MFCSVRFFFLGVSTRILPIPDILVSSVSLPYPDLTAVQVLLASRTRARGTDIPLYDFVQNVHTNLDIPVSHLQTVYPSPGLESFLVEILGCEYGLLYNTYTPPDRFWKFWETPILVPDSSVGSVSLPTLTRVTSVPLWEFPM